MRTEIGTSPRPCGLCTGDDVAIVRSENVRTRLARFDPRWRPKIRVYDRCRTCGARQPLEVPQHA